MKVLFTSAVVSALGLTACMDAGESPGAPADTEQAVSTTYLRFYSSCPSEGCSLAPAGNGWMCVLAGITGDLVNDEGYAGGTGAYIVQSPTTGTWFLHLDPGNVGAMTTCVPVSGPITPVSYPKPGNLNVRVPGTPTTRCFLSGVHNYNRVAFSSFESNVSIQPVPRTNDKLILGNFPDGFSVKVDVLCASIPTLLGDWAYGNGTAQTVTGNLAPNPFPGGVACGLTGIGGAFTSPDLDDGVLVEYATQPPTWGWVLSPWKGAWAECIK
jgi:hypothetical protein